MTDGSVYDLIQHDDFNDRRNNAHDTLWSKNNESHPKTSLERNLKHVFVDLILQWKAKPYATFSELKNNLRERYEKRLNGYNDTFNNELLNYLNQVQNFEARKRNGNLYTFDIPENDVLLDWDKPLSQQPEHVKKALEKILSMEQFNNDENGLEIYDDSSGADLYEQITSFFIAQDEGYDFDDNEDGKRWRRDKTYQKKTSMLLNKFGIPGLRFFDGQSRAKQEGTHNFVIWNEDAIKLLSISDDSNLDAIEYFNKYKAEHPDGFINSQAIEKLDQLVQHSTGNIILNNKFDLRYVGSNAGLGLYGHGAYFEGNIQRDEYYRYFGWVEPPKEIRITSLKDGTVYSNSPDAPEGYGFSDLYDNVDGAAPVLDMLDMDIYDGKVFNTEHYLKMLRLSLGADAEIEGEYNTYHKHNKHSQHSSEEDAYEPASNIGKALKFLDNYKIEFPGFKSRNGNTYIFDIPEDFELLDWNAPLSQQPEQVKHHINEIINELRKRGYSNNDILGVPEHIKMGVSGEGEFVLKNINPNDITGGVLYENISNILGYEGASQIFNQFGIPGHRHWDDNSWKEQKGHHNYLIWNMDKIRMVDITEDSDQEAIDYFNKYRDEHHESYNQNVRNTDDFYLTPEAKKQIQRVREKFEGTESWLRAPNGKKSNLNEAQWLIVRTPNFKRWFGDWEFHPENASKVLDENGEPLVVYHGTLKGGFSVFNTQGLGRTKGTGAWFTDSRQNVEFDSLDSIDVKTLFSEELRFAHSAIQSLKKDGYISSDKIYEGYSKGLFSKDEADHINKRFLDSQNFIRLQSEIFSVINSLDDSIINLNNFNGLSISDEAYYGHSKEKINEAISVLEKLIRDEINSRNRYQIYDTFLNIRNPYIFDANGNEWNDLNGNHDNFTTDKLALQVWGNNPEAFDGIFILNVRDGAKINNKKIIANDYIIPYDTQVKSATRNNGSFSEISDIYKQSARDNYSSGLEADSHNSINNADFINHINNLKQKARNTTPKVIDFDNPNFSSIVNDDDIEQFEQRMFHGTGHIIFGNHFDLKYLGSGEGTCYRGWGIYLGEAYGIGQFYRKFGTPGPILTMKDGSQFRYDDLIKNKANLTYGTDRSYALSLLKGIVKGKSKTIDDLRAYADTRNDEDLLNFIDNIAEIWKTDKKGNIYEIEGPENDVLLDLDASLDNQPAHVKKAINKIKAALKHNPQLNGIDLNAIPDIQDGSTVSLYDAETGLDFYFSISKAVLAHSLIEQGIPLDIEKMSKAQYNLEKKLWTEAKKTASLFFNQFGVPGLRFWDKASREAQKGTHNFVIWDTDTLKFVNIDPSSDNEAIEYFNKTRDEKINSDTDNKPSSDEDEANAMLKSNVDSLNSLNSNINNENSDSYNQIIGIGGAKHLDEEEGVTWRMDNLKIARKMERAKSDSKAIWAATGWIRGKDGQWRIEIPDGKIIRRNLNELRRTSAELQVFDDIFDNDPNYVLSSDEQARYDALVAYDTELHNVFDAPQLYKAYPDIRNISTDIGDLGDNALAAYNPIFDMITINKNVQDLRELRITLIHELQHAIQVREGFAVGFGYNIKNDSQFKKAQRKFNRALSKLDKPSTDRVLEALNAEFIQNDSVKASSMVAQLNPDELNAYNIAREPASIIKSRSDTLFSRYKRHAGETEARNSEKRAYWNEARRKRTPLDMSEDVPRNEQIIGKILPKKSQSANPESFNQSALIVRDKSGNIVHDTEADENLSEAIDWIRDYRHDNPDTPIHDIIENIKWDAEGSSPYGTPEFLDAFRDYSFSIGDETYDNIIHGINADGQTAEIDTPQKQLDKIRKQYEGTDSWLKAPNGKTTNLTEKQWLQVRTPNFKKWFGDWEKHPEHASKVLDSNGEPLVVWHGSPYEFSVFDTKGEGFSHDTGAWFTSKERNAASYGSYVYPTFLNIRNPYVIEGNGRRWNELGDIWIEDSKTGEEFWTDDNGQPFLSKSDAEDYILNKVQDGTFVVDDDARPYSSGDPYDINSFLFDRFYVRDDDLFSHTNDIVRGVFSGEIAAENHDGVIFKAIYDTAYGKDILSDVFVVRSQFNVKSATNNNGNFDSNNQDIYHQKAQIPADIQDEIDELLELNRQAEPEFIKLMSELQSDLGGELITRKQLKSPERIYLKALRAFGGDVSKVGDVLAATLLFDNEDEILDAIINFRKRNDIVHQANRWSKPKRSTGYRDFEAHLRLPNGVVVELQLQLKDMQEVKDGIGHSLYEFMTNNDKYGELHDTIWKAGDLSKRLYAAAVDGSFKALSNNDKERVTSLGRELAETDNPREAERILHSLNDIIDNTLPNDSMHNENSTRTQKQASSIPLDPIAAQYLYETPDSVIIPLDKLIQSKQVDERSVARARKNMNDALNGIINKRKPLTARDNRDGTFYLIDGNDTFTALKELGAKNAPVTFIGGNSRSTSKNQSSNESYNQAASHDDSNHNNFITPELIERFNQPMWHGTRHILLGNKFDLRFLNSGEGGQAYGYGIYLGQAKEVGENYRMAGVNKDSNAFFFAALNVFRNMPREFTKYTSREDFARRADDAFSRISNSTTLRNNLDEAVNFFLKFLHIPDSAEEACRALLKDFVPIPEKGNLYFVDGPEDFELLDWDAPMSQQPHQVLDKLKRAGLYLNDKETGEQLYRRLQNQFGGNKFGDKIRNKEAARKASMTLNDAGIPGHRFWDAFSREDKSGTHNFVIWNTDTLSLLGISEDSDKDAQDYYRAEDYSNAYLDSLDNDSDIRDYSDIDYRYDMEHIDNLANAHSDALDNMPDLEAYSQALDYFNNYKAHHKDGFISEHDIERFDQLVTHATGHIILDNKFDLKYSGSGEGGAMFGHGIYFEQSPEVAEHYRRYGLPNHGLGIVNIHSSDGFTYSNVDSLNWVRSDGQKVDDHNIKITLNSYLSVLAYHPDSTHNDIVKQLSKYLRNELRHFKQQQAKGSRFPVNNFEKAIHDLQQQLDFLLSLKGFDPITPLKGNVYIADIPEDYDLLDWDETLDNQPDAVYERLLKTISIINKTPDKLLALHWAAKSDNHEDTFNFIYPLIEKLYHSGATFTPDDKQKINELLHDKYAADKIEADVRRISKSSFHINNKKATGEKIYKTLVNLFDSKEDASHWLNSQGIPGLRYWDQLSRDKKSGTHNFVIWDMNRITLLGLEGDNQAVDYFRDTALQKLTRNPNEHYRHNESHHTENETYNQIIAEMGAMTDEDKYEGADYRLEDNYTFHNFKTYSQKLSFSQDNSFISPAVLEVFNQIRTHATGNIIYNNKFDLRYRGSSEGSAAFGAGAYFEESPEVAETYRHFGIPNFGLGTISVRNDDESVLSFNSREEWADLHDEDIKAVLNDLSYGAWKYHSSDKSKLIQQYSDDLDVAFRLLQNSTTRKDKRNAEERINTLTKKLDILQNKISFYPKNGNIYDFEIPDDPELMDWDKTIDKQSELVKPILLNIIDEINHNPAPLIAHRLARDFKHPEAMKKKLTPILQALFENIKAFVAEKNHDMDYYSADDIINEFKSIHEFKQLNRIVHSELTREVTLDLYDIIRNPIKPSCTGEELYKCITDLFYMGGLKDYFKNSDFAKVSASDFFNSKGIPGHRFLDRGSRHKGKGTHNYVIWNMSKIKMVSIHPDSDIDAIDYFNKFNQYREAFGDPHEFLTPDMLNEALSKLHDGEREHDLPRQSNEVYHQAIQRKDFDIVSEKQLDEVKKKFKGSPMWLKAPNGRPTNLTERQWLQVRTPNFKNWFGDWEFDPDNSSKVLDINGEPLVVYHGSKHAGFSVFDTSYGAWFSDSRNTSDSYINAVYDSDFDNNTYSVFLNIRNPLVIDYYGKGSLDYGNEPPAYWLDHSNGYDGVICRNIKDRGGYLGGYAEQDEDGNFYEFYDDSVYGVKSPEQIKSANGNNGNFDPHDTDIYLQPANLNDNPFVSRADYPFYNQDTEKAFSDSRNGIQRDRNSKGLKHALLTALRGFKGDYPELAGAEAKAKGLTYAREILRMLNRKSDAQTTMAVHSLTRSLDKLNKKQFEIFTRLLLINDIFNFKRKNPNAPLPLGFTNEALQTESQRFLKLAKSDHDIWEAVNSEHKLNNQIKNQLSALALDLGLKKLADRIKHNHFDSAMIDYANIISRNSPYINGNYIQAMGELRIQQLKDIQRLQAVKDIRDNYDIKHKLIKQFGSLWGLHIPNGYKSWNILARNFIESANSLHENILSSALELTAQQLGLSDETLKSIRESMTESDKSHILVLPVEIVNSINSILESKHRGPIAQFFKFLTTQWKKLMLFFPTRAAKYNIRNITGDLDAVLAGNPKALRFMKQAMSELYTAFYGDDKDIAPELLEFQKRGGALTAQSAQELYDYRKMKEFKHLVSKIDDMNPESWKSMPKKFWEMTDHLLWSGIQKASNYREGWLRYACYLEFLSQMQNDKDGMPDNWGASDPEEVMSIPDIRDRAFKMSNELIGAYDQVSETGRALRDLFIPFYSWMEINATRYLQLLKNGFTLDNPNDFIANIIKSTGIKSPIYAYRIGKTLLMVNLLALLVKAFNHLVWPDDEDKLPPDVKERPHITLGHDPITGEILYFDRIGALTDNLEWFAGDSFASDIKDILDGKISVTDWVLKVCAAPLNKIFQGITPLIKTPFELASGKSLYPDFTNPRNINDRLKYIAQSFGLAWPYKAITGEPRSDWHEFKNLFLYSSDADEAAYFYTLGLVRQFREKVLGKRSGGFSMTKRSLALQNLKKALRFNDKKAVERSLNEYYSLGGNNKGIKTSMRNMNPLYSLSRVEQQQFLTWISDDDKKYLERANAYFQNIIHRLYNN